MNADVSMPADSAVHLDLRLLHYFVVVAELRHFGDAAARLRIAQPSLSRHIRRLEQQIGARLLDRGPRGTALTDAGQVLLSRARLILQSTAHAVAETREAAQPSRLTVGYTTGLIVTSAIRELRRRHPNAQVTTSHLSWDEPRGALLDHRVDAVVARMPFPTKGLSVAVLYEEPRLLLVAVDHRLADRVTATLHDISDEPIPRLPDDDWNRFWRIDPRPDGRTAPSGPLVESLEDKIELIASGQVVSIAPAGSVALFLRPDLVAIPLEDAEPAEVVLATRAEDCRFLLSAFGQVARTHVRPVHTVTPADV